MANLLTGLRAKIVATIFCVAAAVVFASGYQSLNADAAIKRNIAELQYTRFDASRKSTGMAFDVAVSFIAGDAALVAALSGGDRALIAAEAARAGRALDRTLSPGMVAIVDASGAFVQVPGHDLPMTASQASASRLLLDLRGGLTVNSALVRMGRKVWQVSGAPVVDDAGRTIGAVLAGEDVRAAMETYREQSDASAERQTRLTLLDLRGDTVTSTFPPSEWDAIEKSSRREVWRKDEKKGRDVTEYDGQDWDVALTAVDGYDGGNSGSIGSFVTMRQRAAEDREKAQKETQILLLSGLALVLALVIGTALAFAVTRPLVRAIKATDDLAHGGGDLTKRLDARSNDELGRLAKNLNAVFGHILELAQKVQRAAFQVGASSAEISAASKQMLEGAREQARKTESSTAAVTELSASIQQVAQNAMEATRMARSSGEAVGRAIDSMGQIRTTVDSAAQRIQELGESGKRIGNIVEVIRQISDQTTLLALNAAIEAAHAGEQGRGFAVVADEVSSLAKRVGQSARDIEDLIATIKEQTVEAVAAMSEGTREVEVGTKLVTTTLADLQKLVQVVADTANSVQEQAVASDEIARNMDVVQRIAQDVLGASEEAVAQGEHLHQLAHGLEESVKGFRTSGVSDVGPGGRPFAELPSESSHRSSK
jgi:methyl-accepting chemotaxis protein